MSTKGKVAYWVGYMAIAIPLFIFYVAYSFTIFFLLDLIGKEAVSSTEVFRENLPLILGLVTVMGFITNVCSGLARVDYSSKLHEGFKEAAPLFFISTIAAIALVAFLVGSTLDIQDKFYGLLLSTPVKRICSAACASVSGITCVGATFTLIRFMAPVVGNRIAEVLK